MINKKTGKLKKVLILGSGAIRIGQAGEFDYSGSQAIKALNEEGIKTILINPNIATIQTSDYLADKVYFLPIDANFIEKVIIKEKPDGILLSFGGQTALDAGVELFERGVFKKYNVKILGTPIESILNTEDRDLFVKKIKEINLKVPISKVATNVEEAAKIAEKIGYPVMCRIAYALGGLGSGVAHNKKQLLDITKKAFSFTKQILIEEYFGGWKEIECEVVRDRYDNCIVVCSMENVDPMGVHTGESIVVAPVQTLTASEIFKLRAISIKVIRHLGIIGECNIQFALDPKSEEYKIIEVNARLSRSSALASKATGYPLAFIAAKLALGYNLTEIKNIITRKTSACFEPSLDYIVVKYPRWDLQKFRKVSFDIGSEMKSVGEVMGIGRSYEEAIQKAIRMLDVGMKGLICNDLKFNDLEKELKGPTDKRLFAIAEAIKQGYSIEKIYNLSGVDPWFLYKIRNIVQIGDKLRRYDLKNLSSSLLKKAKQNGFSDIQIAILTKSDAVSVRRKRKKIGIVPFVKQIDTLAAEYPAKTNYLYLTYNGCKDDITFKDKNQVVVLGGGAYRIGSSVEFDWCCVNSVASLRKMRYRTILINCNPETVSTDYDICDKLYFDELTFERVLDICEKENPLGVIISMGGQIPNNLALPLHKAGVSILGTSPVDIDRAEDRHKFSYLLDKLEIDQPEWKELTSLEEAEKFADKVGYPVLVRPSYVLSGAAMSIALSKNELKKYLKKASEINKVHPVVISKFITGAKEIEIDAVARQGNLYCYAISEHVENAGVHSGGATMVLPPQRTYLETMRKIKIIAKKIAGSLKITGPFNIQFIAKDNDVKVIECNLRASRSFPFVSKVFKINFIDLATKIIVGKRTSAIDRSSFDLDYVGIKAPQFSFTRLRGSDPILGVEMSSTGEVACLCDDFNEAFIKSFISVGFKLPKKTILLSTGPIDSKAEFLESTRILEKMGFKFYATGGTADFMKANKIK
ncbi:MAG: carbamoyl-phosphate synthase (glutamine-hydrolyzing) large subunit, partial [Thermoplasmatales archaeon]